MSGAYYNEIDPYAAQWLRNLIMLGYIADGDVDERSIEDVRPEELRKYTQCHFFAGIGIWSHALRGAGWSDDRPVWTGSCPCQPFSAAGKRSGTADERHLWPAWFHLIAHGKPRGVPVFGEQVASKDGLAWLDLVHADLEGQGYTVRALDLCAAGVGAPHIRQRLYFVADDASQRRDRSEFAGETGAASTGGTEAQRGRAAGIRESARCGATFGLADTGRAGNERVRGPGEAPAAPGSNEGEAQQRQRGGAAAGTGGASRQRHVGDTDDARPQGRSMSGTTAGGNGAGERAAGAPSFTNGHWTDCDWLPCIDGKARPVEPGTFPLAHGVVARVGRLRAYGNAIVAPLAEEFIRAYLSE
jgi:DNA (cytosine-5)-methyltransferase 1